MIHGSNPVAISLERPREKIDSNHLIRESKIHNLLFIKDSRMKKDSRIIDDSNQDQKSEIFDTRQAPLLGIKMWSLSDLNFLGPLSKKHLITFLSSYLDCEPKAM